MQTPCPREVGGPGALGPQEVATLDGGTLCSAFKHGLKRYAWHALLNCHLRALQYAVVATAPVNPNICLMS